MPGKAPAPGSAHAPSPGDVLDIFHDRKRTASAKKPGSGASDAHANRNGHAKSTTAGRRRAGPGASGTNNNTSTAEINIDNNNSSSSDSQEDGINQKPAQSGQTRRANRSQTTTASTSANTKSNQHQASSSSTKMFAARERIRNLGVMKRSPMGEYIDRVQLSQLAVPTPGPLDYDPKLPQSGVQHSILGKHANGKEGRDNIGPGPAKYDVRNVRLPYDGTPHWSFGHKFSQQKVKDDMPGPFAYYATQRTFGTENSSYTMSGRFSAAVNETPGPDRYLPKSEFGATGTRPKYSFGLKPTTLVDTTPGPLDYNVPPCPPSAVKCPSFTMRRRLEESFRNKDAKPGPNQYYPVLPASEKMASLKGIHKENKSLKTPGPANYIIPTDFFGGLHYTLTARNIPYQDTVFIAPNPGPADYNPDLKITRDKQPSFSLGSRPKSSKQGNGYVPGPGAYHPRDRQIRGNDKPKVTIKSRRSKSLEKTPGPADYNSHVPASTVTPAQLERNASGHHVGAERLKSIIEESPGPADYNLKPISVVKATGPAYSLRKRLESHKAEHSPGPNAYYALPTKNRSKITMKSRMSPFVMVFPTNRVDTLQV